MKRIATLFFFLALTAATTATAGMSIGHIRQETRFLTDKMAYELELDSRQYNDVYEINFDFVYSLRNVMDAAARGYGWATEEYHTALAVRNDDLRWVLSEWQYSRFLGLDYFYRPLHLASGRWSFRIYTHYPNRTLYYYGLPTHYRTYAGERRRAHLRQESHYRGRYVQERCSVVPQRAPQRHMPERSHRRAEGYSIGATTHPATPNRTLQRQEQGQPRHRTEGYSIGRESRPTTPQHVQQRQNMPEHSRQRAERITGWETNRTAVAPTHSGRNESAGRAQRHSGRVENGRSERSRRAQTDF